MVGGRKRLPGFFPDPAHTGLRASILKIATASWMLASQATQVPAPGYPLFQGGAAAPPQQLSMKLELPHLSEPRCLPLDATQEHAGIVLQRGEPLR